MKQKEKLKKLLQNQQDNYYYNKADSPTPATEPTTLAPVTIIHGTSLVASAGWLGLEDWFGRKTELRTFISMLKCNISWRSDRN